MSKRGDNLTLPPLPNWWAQLANSQRRQVKEALREIASLRGFMPLLMKTRNGGQWTPAEKAELLCQLRTLTRVSPYILMLILPGSAFMLPAYAWWLDRRRHGRR
jgi:hypothetical protein